MSHRYYFPSTRERMNLASKRRYSERELRAIAKKDMNEAIHLALQSARDDEQLTKWYQEFLGTDFRNEDNTPKETLKYLLG